MSTARATARSEVASMASLAAARIASTSDRRSGADTRPPLSKTAVRPSNPCKCGLVTLDSLRAPLVRHKRHGETATLLPPAAPRGGGLFRGRDGIRTHPP